MKQFPFDISVIMSVYNVEAYIREAVESVIGQTIGFERIQLIFVDDGSPDGCGAICDEYAAKHPANVQVIHKQNGGLSSARNEGLKHVKGKYVNFLDPDDYIDKDAFEKVFRFMEEHPECDVCSIPMRYFGDRVGLHALCNKYEKGTRVIDLLDEKDADCIQMHVGSAFYRADTAAQMHFDTVIYAGEDAIVNQFVFLENPHLGLVANAEYHYRVHGTSLMTKTQFRHNWYIEYINRFYRRVIDAAIAKYGSLPLYVQYTLMYDINGRLRQDNIPTGILTGDEQLEYTRLLWDCVFRIDDDVILAQQSMSMTRKLNILRRKHTNDPEKVKQLVWEHIGEMETAWDFLTIDGKTCALEGYHRFVGVDAECVEPILLVNGKALLCERVNRDKMRENVLGELISDAIGFRVSVPISDLPARIVPAVRVNGQIIERKEICYRYFFPVSGVYKNAFYVNGVCMVTVRDNALVFDKKPAFPALAVREVKWLKEIWQKNLLGGRKAVAGRLYYHLVKPFKRRQLWILSDRVNKADDNGEALFRYLMLHKPKNTRVLFALRKDSPDRPALEKVGKCIEPFSFRHKLLHLLCDMEISAQAEIASVFSGYNDPLRDILQHQKFVFLQHGVIATDLSGWLTRYKQNIRGFVTSAYREAQAIIEYDYGYSTDIVWLAGLPRHDFLYHDEQHIITVMPTWRKYLYGSVDIATGLWQPIGDLTRSRYFQFYGALLSSKKLLDALEANGYTLQFFPHPNMQAYVDLFGRDSRVRLVPLNTPYRDIFAHSNMVITDYTSAVFDFAYLRKPLIYCQFDKEEFFSGNHVGTPGYFSYERDGFGEVEYTLEATIDRIIEYVQNGCEMKEEYRRRADAFFAFNDQNNCARVSKKIEQLANEP